MARIQGRLGQVLMSLDGGTTYTAINGLKDATLNGSQAEIKVTAHDDGQYETYLPGRKDFSIDMKLVYDEGDAGQTNVTNSFYSGTTNTFKFTLQTGVGFKQAICSGFVTKLADGQPNDDAASYDVTIRLSGALTWTNQ